ncbi:hypothetical protein ACL1HZ_14550, partial [Corynebacterium striatum]
AVAVSGTGTVDNPVTVSGERAGLLLDAIRGAFQLLGLDTASGDARRYLVPVGRYRVPTGADIGYRG